MKSKGLVKETRSRSMWLLYQVFNTLNDNLQNSLSFCLFLVCTGAVAAGTLLGWTSNISAEMKEGNYNDLPIDDSVLGWIGSFTALGAMLMCFPIGIICDFLGRKLTMLLLIVPFCIGWLLLIFAKSLVMVYIGRFVTGMAGGAFCVTAPLYTSEIAEKEVRGALGSYFQLFLTIGILFSYVLATFVNILTYNIVLAIVPLVFGVVFVLQPETPVYLLKKDKENEARKVLRKLRGNNYDVDAELKSMKLSIENDAKLKVPFTQSIKKKATQRAFLISFGLMFFQQLSGINAVIFYTGDIFIAAGSSLDSKYATIIVGVIQVAATFVSSLVVDKFGRKLLLLGSDFFMAISGILLGIFFSITDYKLADQETIDKISFLPILALSIFLIVFSLGFGPIPWMISAEVYPAEVKSSASSAAGTFNWFLAFLVTKFYIDVKNAVGGDVTFYIFSAISLVGTAFIYFIVPETKGKSLEQIQIELGGEEQQKKGVDNEGFSP